MLEFECCCELVVAINGSSVLKSAVTSSRSSQHLTIGAASQRSSIRENVVAQHHRMHVLQRATVCNVWRIVTKLVLKMVSALS